MIKTEPFSELEPEENPPAHPPLRQNAEMRWPRGVVSGGTVIDILEYLSQTARASDYVFVLWLQRHYIQPFGRIERLDGLVVTCDEDLEPLHLSYERYIASQGPLTRLQRLFVPGLEPTYTPLPNAIKLEDDVPYNTAYAAWRASEMYAKNGIEVKRKGVCEGYWVDEKKWERTLWSVRPGDEAEAGIGIEVEEGGWKEKEEDGVKEERRGESAGLPEL